jgi:hypothetical protein
MHGEGGLVVGAALRSTATAALNTLNSAATLLLLLPLLVPQAGNLTSAGDLHGALPVPAPDILLPAHLDALGVADLVEW